MIDTGIANTVSFRFSEDKGQMLETLVYRHLKKQGYGIYFHRGKKECDFVIKEELKITQVIQVTCSLTDPKTVNYLAYVMQFQRISLSLH